MVLDWKNDHRLEASIWLDRAFVCELLAPISDTASKPLVLVPLAYQGIYLSQPGALFAVLALISLPMIVIFLLVQRNLVNGLAGSVK